MKSFFVLFVVIIAVAASPLRFDGQKVLRIYADDSTQLEQLKKVIGEDADIWSRESTLGIGANDIRVDEDTEALIMRLGLKVESFVEDLQGLIDSERNESMLHAQDDTFFTAYHRYAEIVTYMQSLASSYPNLCTFIPSIGQTIQGRNIPALRITATSNSANVQRFWFNGGQHAREWIGPATVLYLATQLLEQYGNNNVVSNLVNTVAFDIVPLVNPDGYEFAWTTNRLWRKNRRLNSGTTYGVDLNRNWNDHWGGAGSSKVASSDTYCGTKPFSEPESLALSNYISSLNNIIGGIDFHSYSQLVLRPYGWTSANCPDEQAFRTIGAGVSYEIEEVSGLYYENIKSIDLYITTGTSTDWWYQEGMWAPFCIELRDTGKYGFVLPPNQIIPTGQEIWSSMLFFWETVLNTYPY